jgi:hypothetical protein
VRCYDGDLFGVSREIEPNAGLLAADPDDVRLHAVLQRYQSALTYSDYVKALRSRGLHVADAATGYVIQDEQGHRFHESYRLHGVYHAKTNEPAWTSKTGETLRAALNRHLGAELVRWGPHDTWEFRNQPQIAGPLYGPQVPVLVFDHDQNIHERLAIGDLIRGPYRFRWNELFPHHARGPGKEGPGEPGRRE